MFHPFEFYPLPFLIIFKPLELITVTVRSKDTYFMGITCQNSESGKTIASVDFVILDLELTGDVIGNFHTDQ